MQKQPFYLKQGGVFAAPANATAIPSASVNDGQVVVSQVGGGRQLHAGEPVWLEVLRCRIGIKADIRVTTDRAYEAIVNGNSVVLKYAVDLSFSTFDKPLAQVQSEFLAVFSPDPPQPNTQSPQAPTKTIGIGMTVKEVEDILGAPKTKAASKSGLIYLYPDLKVIFTDGVVSDIQ